MNTDKIFRSTPLSGHVKHVRKMQAILRQYDYAKLRGQHVKARRLLKKADSIYNAVKEYI